MCPDSPMRCSNSADVPRQAGVRRNLHALVSSPVAWTLEGRGEVTGDGVTSGVGFVDEGGKNTARAKKGGYP
jgi:hypothetical protein